MDKKDLLDAICIAYDDGNKAAFARRLGIMPQTLHGWLNRGRIEYDTIYRYCPDINPIWLLTNGEEGDIKETFIKDAKGRSDAELERLRLANQLLQDNLRDLRAAIGVNDKKTSISA